MVKLFVNKNKSVNFHVLNVLFVIIDTRFIFYFAIFSNDHGNFCDYAELVARSALVRGLIWG